MFLASRGNKARVILHYKCTPCTYEPSRMLKTRSPKPKAIHQHHTIRQLSQRKQMLNAGISLGHNFVLSCIQPYIPISAGASRVQEGNSLLHPQPAVGKPSPSGAVLTWSSLQCMMEICGAEMKGCCSGLSLLIRLYSNWLLRLSCKTNRRTESLRKQGPEMLISPSPAGFSS